MGDANKSLSRKSSGTRPSRQAPDDVSQSTTQGYPELTAQLYRTYYRDRCSLGESMFVYRTNDGGFEKLGRYPLHDQQDF